MSSDRLAAFEGGTISVECEEPGTTLKGIITRTHYNGSVAHIGFTTSDGHASGDTVEISPTQDISTSPLVLRTAVRSDTGRSREVVIRRP